MSLRNVSWLSLDYSALFPRRWHSSEAHVSHCGSFCNTRGITCFTWHSNIAWLASKEYTCHFINTDHVCHFIMSLPWKFRKSPFRSSVASCWLLLEISWKIVVRLYLVWLLFISVFTFANQSSYTKYFFIQSLLSLTGDIQNPSKQTFRKVREWLFRGKRHWESVLTNKTICYITDCLNVDLNQEFYTSSIAVIETSSSVTYFNVNDKMHSSGYLQSFISMAIFCTDWNCEAMWFAERAWVQGEVRIAKLKRRASGVKRDSPVNLVTQQEEHDFQTIGTPYLTHLCPSLTIRIARVADIFGQEIDCPYGAKRFIIIFTENPRLMLRQQVESISQYYTKFL